jgi:hypothetical protein
MFTMAQHMKSTLRSSSFVHFKNRVHVLHGQMFAKSFLNSVPYWIQDGLRISRENV